MNLGARIRSSRSNNWALKVLSFASALALYSLVHTSQDVQRTVLVNVTVETPPDSAGRILTSPVPAQARVTVRGSRTALDEIRAEDLGSFQLDLRAGQKTRLTFESSELHLPPGAKVVQVEPASVDLVWEDRLVREVPVQIGIVGALAPGFKVRGVPVADPALVRVKGPKSEVVNLQTARAEPIDVAGLGEGRHARQLTLERLGRLVSAEPAKVIAIVEVTRELTERTFTRLPVVVVGHTKASVHPAWVDVRVSCPPEVTRALRADVLVPRARLATTAEQHGSESVDIKVVADRCDVVTTPSSVVVRW
jgi:hypothetical protein